MKLMIDSIDLEQIKKAFETELISGVTTTPTFARKAKIFYGPDLLASIRKLVGREVDIYWTVAVDKYDLLLRKCHEHYQFLNEDKHLIFKIPISSDGLKASKTLNDEGIRTAMHLVYNINQAYLSSLKEVEAIFPLIGRSEDILEGGVHFVRAIRDAFKINNTTTNIIAASIRNPMHVAEMYKLGIYAITIPSNLLEKLPEHALSSAGISDFERDYKESLNYK